jgi:hypothetical protein
MKMRLLATLTALIFTAAVQAHSASDAYLTLDTPVRGAADTVVEGQWDIALRDLNFVLKLDGDGDGSITWSEVRKRQAEIARYAFANLRASADGTACAVEPSRQLVTDHADGAYAALIFRIVCKGAPRQLSLDYRLFFAVDPTHRGILVFRAPGGTATSLLSPENAKVGLALP